MLKILFTKTPAIPCDDIVACQICNNLVFFIFCSVIPQQKTIALSTLSRIIENFKKGRFDSCFGPETNLLNQLIQADLVTLLRTGKAETSRRNWNFNLFSWF